MIRPTPYEAIFEDTVEIRFPSVQGEARLTRKDATDLAQFASLPTVQHILADIESPSVLEDNPAAAEEYLTLLYVAFRFWEAGKVVRHVKREDWSDVVPVGKLERTAVPSGACYLQFSERWFWAQITATAPHEPLDGIFLAQSGDGSQLVVVAVLGLRAEREGFSQVSLAVGTDEVEQVLSAAPPTSFPPLMEGGREAGFRSVESAADLLLLAHLALIQTAA